MTEKLSKLHHDGHITDDEYNRLKKALNSLKVDEMYQLEMEQADQFIPLSVLQEIRAELTKYYVDPYNRNAFRYATVSLLDVLDLIDKHIKEYTK